MKWLGVALVAFVIACGAADCFARGNDATASEHEKARLADMATAAIAGMGGSYSGVLKTISPAALPESSDYILHMPAGMDFSISLDSFKDDYCAAAALSSRARLSAGPPAVEIIDWEKTFKKSGVLLPAPALRNSVRSLAVEFKDAAGKDIYDYTTTVSRKAMVRLGARLVSPAAQGSESVESCEAEYRIEFVDHDGAWKLFHAKLIRSGECAGGQFGPDHKTEPSPYYKNCGVQ